MLFLVWPMLSCVAHLAIYPNGRINSSKQGIWKHPLNLLIAMKKKDQVFTCSISMKWAELTWTQLKILVASNIFIQVCYPSLQVKLYCEHLWNIHWFTQTLWGKIGRGRYIARRKFSTKQAAKENWCKFGMISTYKQGSK